MDETSEVLNRVADLHQRIYITLLSPLTEHWMSVDYTMPQLKVLLCLYFHGPNRMKDLASTLGVSTPTATGIINRLVRRSLVARNHDSEDRRVVTCRLSPKGAAQIAALWTSRFAVFQDIFGSLPAAELEVVARAAEVVLKAAERRNPGPVLSLGLSRVETLSEGRVEGGFDHL